MTYHYKDLPAEDKKSVLDYINTHDSGQRFNLDHTKVLIQDLPFAKRWHRLVCEDFSSMPYIKKDYLFDGEIIVPCVYTSDPFENNHLKDMGLNITQDHAAFYLKFYCDYWIMGQDKIIPISYIDDINWQDDISPTMKQALNNDLQNYPIINETDNGLSLDLMCVFRQSIMIISFNIANEGAVKITDRKSLIEDLPIRNFA